MSILELYTPEVKRFVLEHINDNVSNLALKSHGKIDAPMAFVLDQIKCRQKLKNKVAEWYNHPDLIFPDSMIGEQCSSEVTAAYKADLVQGNTFLDLTGGLGVDTFFLSKKFKKGIYVEPDINKLTCVKYNFKLLGVKNIEFINSTAEDFLSVNKKKFDLIYIDPSRRVESKKIIGLEDSVPNVTQLSLEKSADTVIIKTSPVMDIKLASRGLNCISEIHVISVKNDCKEVLYVLNENHPSNIFQVAINYNGMKLERLEDSESLHSQRFSKPLRYLYEPNASIMKFGMFGQLITQYSVGKLHQNSHLFTSDDKIENFPGRIFKIISVVNYDRKGVSNVLKSKKANVSTRNFPDSVDQIRKKLKLNDGGTSYLFATTLIDESKVIIVCEKI